MANGDLVKGAGCGTRHWNENFVLTDESGGALFTVARTTGDVTTEGDLTITGTLTAGAVVDGGGAVALSSTLDVAGDFSVATNKMTVAAASGNTAIAGTANVVGDFSVATNKMTVAAASGNTAIAGTANVVGDFSVATNKLTVAAASGNTAVAGTLGVTGAVTASAALALSLETGLTAGAGGTQAAGSLALGATKVIHNVTIVATDADSVILPAATGSGKIHFIKNSDAAQSIQVFAAATETIDDVASATGVAIAAGKARLLVDIAAGKWVSLLGA